MAVSPHHPPPAPLHALVVAAGDVDLALLAELATAEPPPLLIAADGGAAHVAEAGLCPDVVAGDFDSLSASDRASLEAAGVELRVAEPDKDESDTELCLLAAVAAGARRITVLGALGPDRPEHSVANLLLLADPRFEGVELVIAGRGSRIVCSGTDDGPGEVAIEGEPADFVSLLPLGAAAEGVSTEGLRFALDEEDLPLGPTRGLSNELLGTRAMVRSRRGRLLVIHTRRPSAGEPGNGGT